MGPARGWIGGPVVDSVVAMTIQMIGSGPQNLIVFLVLAAFGVVAWFSIRRNIRGIDFDEVPSGPALKEGASARSAAPEAGTTPDEGSPAAGVPASGDVRPGA